MNAADRALAYDPDCGGLLFLDFEPQVGWEQAKRRAALVLIYLRYNPAK
jgi:mRNA-degrading endonuclease toxin of MazEF toxin-antitoxin module